MCIFKIKYFKQFQAHKREHRTENRKQRTQNSAEEDPDWFE